MSNNYKKMTETAIANQYIIHRVIHSLHRKTYVYNNKVTVVYIKHTTMWQKYCKRRTILPKYYKNITKNIFRYYLSYKNANN